MSTEEQDSKKSRIHEIRQRIRVTKIVATRSVRGRTGDSFVGMCSTFDSVEPSSGLDMVPEELVQDPHGGLSTLDARVAAILLGLEVDVAALKMSFGSGDLRGDLLDQRIQEVTANYNRLLHSMKIR